METEEEVTTTPAATKKTTRMVRVSQKVIDHMLKEPPRRPSLPLPVFSDEVLERLNMPGLNATMARATAAYKRCVDLDADILRQYRTRGYAEVEEPVTDDDEVAAPVRRRSKKKPATTRNNK